MRLKSINDMGRHIRPISSQVNEAVRRVVESGWFVLGPEVTAFESEFAEYCGTPFCVSLASGTEALELALRALDIGPGKTVLTVANAGMYSSIAILATGANPLYCEVSEDTLLVQVSAMRQLLAERKVDAIIVTHLYGMLADMHDIIPLAQAAGIPVIEDCAQAHGAQRGGIRAGAFGDMACFSFYPTKNLGALGDGGAITTSRQDLADRVRQLRQYGWSEKYRVEIPHGRNSRLDEIQAAILRVKLPHLDQWNARRREIAQAYSEGISNPKVVTPSVHRADYVSHLYVLRASNRGDLRKHLAERGIPSDVHYPIPDYKQPAYSNLFANMRLVVTERVCNEVLTIPCFPEMTDHEVESVVAGVNAW